MKILLVGECYSENLGDGVICQTVDRVLQEHFPGVQIDFLDLSGRVSYQDVKEENLTKTEQLLQAGFLVGLRLKNCAAYRACRQAPVRSRLLWRQLKRRLRRKYDLILFAGGALIMDYFAGAIAMVVQEAERKRIPVVFHACGMGACNADSIQLFQEAFSKNCVKAISLRDSFARFTEIFPSITARETFDTALACARYFSRTEKGNTMYGIGLISMSRYYEEQKKMLQSFLVSGTQWKIFTNGASYDQRFAQTLLSDLGISPQEQKKYLVDRAKTPEELIKTVTSFQYIISYRMHSQIIAASYGIPSLGLVWDEKVREHYYKLGFAQNCCAPEAWRMEMIAQLGYKAEAWKRKADQAALSSINDLIEQIQGVRDSDP